MSSSIAQAFLAIRGNNVTLLSRIIYMHKEEVLADGIQQDLISLSLKLGFTSCAQKLISSKILDQDLSKLYGKIILSENKEALLSFFDLNKDLFESKNSNFFKLIPVNCFKKNIRTSDESISSNKNKSKKDSGELIISLLPESAISYQLHDPSDLLVLSMDSYFSCIKKSDIFYWTAKYHTNLIKNSNNAMKYACAYAALICEDLALFIALCNSIKARPEDTCLDFHLIEIKSSYGLSCGNYACRELHQHSYFINRLSDYVLRKYTCKNTALEALNAIKEIDPNRSSTMKEIFSGFGSFCKLISHDIGVQEALFLVDELDTVKAKKLLTYRYLESTLLKVLNNKKESVSKILKGLEERGLITPITLEDYDKINPSNCNEDDKHTLKVSSIINENIRKFSEHLSVDLVLLFSPYHPISFVPKKRKSISKNIKSNLVISKWQSMALAETYRSNTVNLFKEPLDPRQIELLATKEGGVISLLSKLDDSSLDENKKILLSLLN
jgi:hypothetical protein